MKIHPHELLLEELLASVPADRREMLGHVLRCERCREKAQGMLAMLQLQAAAAPPLSPGKALPAGGAAKVLRWPGRGQSSLSVLNDLDYGPALERSTVFFRERQAAHERERAEAAGLGAELLAHPPERRPMLARHQPRFHTWGVYQLLVERSRERSFQEPREAESLAQLALELADHLDAGYYGAHRIEDLRARAWGHAGNARRVGGDLAAAGEAFERAFEHLARGTREPLERAILLDLRASLLRAERRFDDAMKLLEEALGVFLEAGDHHRAGRALVGLDNVLHHAGRPEEGIPLLYRALELIDPAQEPRLLLCAWHNLIDDLAEAGRFMEAQKLLRQAEPVYRRSPEPWSQTRRLWVEGKIARGLGQQERAEALLRAARDGFLAQDLPYDLALVSLELAALCAEQGRAAEVRRIAAEMLPLFSSRRIHREALAALTLWRDAAVAAVAGAPQALTAELLGYLKRARFDPELRFSAAERR